MGRQAAGTSITRGMAVGLVLTLAAAASARAQVTPGSQGAAAGRFVSPQTVAPGVVGGGGGLGEGGASLLSPGYGADIFAPREGAGREIPSMLPPGSGVPSALQSLVPGQVGLLASARFGKSDGPISGGLDWRVYSDRPNKAGQFRLVKEDTSAAPTFVLPPGGYVVHVSLGMASAVRHVQLRGETVREIFDIRAGGIRLEGRVGGVRIPAEQIRFDIYPGSQFDSGQKQPIATQVMTGEVVIVPDGTYHFVSSYGDANSIIRSDIRVRTGKLTDVTVTHHAAVITLKLVSAHGGEALANTAWSVITPGGDVIKESIGAFPRFILAEGDYRVIARNDDKVFERPLSVKSGVDGEVEVLAK